jgi:hypothetical protein
MKIGAGIFAALAMVSSYANAAEFTVGYAEVSLPLIGRILFFESRGEIWYLSSPYAGMYSRDYCSKYLWVELLFSSSAYKLEIVAGYFL